MTNQSQRGRVTLSGGRKGLSGRRPDGTGLAEEEAVGTTPPKSAGPRAGQGGRMRAAREF